MVTLNGGKRVDQFVLTSVLCGWLLRVMISFDGEIIFCCIGNMRLVVSDGGLDKIMWIVQSSFGGKI